MKKKFISILLVLAMVFALAACTSSNEPAPAEPSGEGETEPAEEGTVYKVGMVCIGDDNAAYDRNFYMAADAAKEQLAAKGIDIEWVYTYNHPAGDPVAVDCEELADAGCVAVFCNSYGQEDAMLTVAGDYPDTVFAGLTNEGSMRDSLDNTVNAFPNIFEGRYLEGVIAGCKLQQMVDEGEIAPEEAVIGYVGAYTFAEVISGYTSFYLGAKSVCPDVIMKVQFTGSWYDEKGEKEAAENLIAAGADLLSQHADSMGAPTACENAGIPDVSYNGSTVDSCPNTFIVASRINWAPYFEYIVNQKIAGEKIDTDWTGTIATGSVVLTDVNEQAAAAGTVEKIAEVKAELEAGTLHVFDTATEGFITKDNAALDSYLADVDTDEAYTPDTEVVADGYFHESEYRSAPYFDVQIDGIDLLNVAF